MPSNSQDPRQPPTGSLHADSTPPPGPANGRLLTTTALSLQKPALDEDLCATTPQASALTSPQKLLGNFGKYELLEELAQGGSIYFFLSKADGDANRADTFCTLTFGEVGQGLKYWPGPEEMPPKLPTYRSCKK